MRRMQDSTFSKSVIFVDSTSSCDATEFSVTPILGATPAGAVPLAIGFHSSQTTEGYSLLFKLLVAYNPTCFGGEPVSKFCSKIFNETLYSIVSKIQEQNFYFFCVLNRYLRHSWWTIAPQRKEDCVVYGLAARFCFATSMWAKLNGTGSSSSGMVSIQMIGST